MDMPIGRILIVDDNEVIRSTLKVFLEADYEVTPRQMMSLLFSSLP